MERRRKALGLRKQNVKTDQNEKATTSKIKESYYEEKPKSPKDGKNSKLKVMVNQNSPKRYNRPSLKDSPCSPLQSPGIQPLFPRNLASPEIEVSWDWGCSQVPRDMAPSRRKRVQSQTSSSLKDDVSSLTHCPRVWGKQMSEQENQERLAFYKNVLSQPSKDNSQMPVTSENIPNKSCEDEMAGTTPKRPSKAVHVRRTPDNISAFFDDSANEFMLECSQAVEEQLKNGEIKVDPVVNIKVLGQKHAHSPVLNEGSSLKRSCLGRTKNLFPSSDVSPKCSVGDRRRSLRSPKINLVKSNLSIDTSSQSICKENTDSTDDDDDVLFLRPTQVNPTTDCNKNNCSNNSYSNIKDNAGQMVQNKIIATQQDFKVNGQCNIEKTMLTGPVNENSTLKKSAVNSKQLLSVNNNVITNGNNNSCQLKKKTEKTSAKYDSVDKFRSTSRGNSLSNKQMSSQSRAGNSASVNTNITTPVNVNEVDSRVQINRQELKKSSSVQAPKNSSTDVTTLLDDEFDMELSSLDFETICCNSGNKGAPVQPMKILPSKSCTQEEIEAKRMAALKRLRLKKRI